MRFHILAVGRMRRDPLIDVIADYAGRLQGRLLVVECVTKQSLPPDRQRAAEAELLLERRPDGAVGVALDGGGRAFSSEALADYLERQQNAGIRDIAFMIGGAYGHGPAVLDAADLTLSLGPMTWPHRLARAMLAEQIYRAECIRSGHPYHHGDAA